MGYMYQDLHDWYSRQPGHDRLCDVSSLVRCCIWHSRFAFKVSIAVLQSRVTQSHLSVLTWHDCNDCNCAMLPLQTLFFPTIVSTFLRFHSSCCLLTAAICFS